MVHLKTPSPAPPPRLDLRALSRSKRISALELEVHWALSRSVRAARCNDFGERENVILKCGGVQRKRGVNAQDFSHIAQRLLSGAISRRGCGIRQISV